MSASNAKISSAAATADREIVITRVFDAPRELIWEAWTDPQHVAKWWGPNGFTTTTHAMELRVGGAWRFIMHGPDGVDYPNQIDYIEIARPERLVYNHGSGEPDDPGQFHVTVTFAEQGSQTKVTMQCVFASAAERDKVVKEHKAIEGGNQTLARLAEYLPTLAKRNNAVDHPAAATADREIVISRLLNAPREMVWDAWTDPKQVVQWWGPRGFTTTIHEMDVRPGGVWWLTMHGPDGTDYPNKSVFIEVVKHERIVFSHGGGKKGGPGASFEATWTFEARGDKTLLTMRSVFASAAARDLIVKEYGAIEGGKQTLDRLEEQLAIMSGSPFVISRVFDAPRELVWKAFAEPERMEQWWGPKGMTTRIARLEFRPGGVFLYSMRAPDGKDWWGKWVYREIVAPEKMITVVSFTDENGNPVRHPLSPTWPLEVLSIATFSEQGSKTLLTLRSTPINASEIERKTFEAGIAGMGQGFNATWDHLAEYLAKG